MSILIDSKYIFSNVIKLLLGRRQAIIEGDRQKRERSTKRSRGACKRGRKPERKEPRRIERAFLRHSKSSL